MGSFTRVKVHYQYLADFFQGSKKKIYGAFLDGKNVIAAEALMQDVRDDLFQEGILGDTEPLQVRNGRCPTCEEWKPEREEFPLGEYVCAECSEP